MRRPDHSDLRAALLFVAFVALGPSLTARAQPRSRVLQLLLGTQPAIDHERLVAALRLYLGDGSFEVVRVVGQPSEAALTGQATTRPTRTRQPLRAWWRTLEGRIEVTLARGLGGEAELLSFSVALPAHPDANFYRSVALKLKTLLRVATARAADEPVTPASRPASAPVQVAAPAHARASARRPPWVLAVGLLGGAVVPTDTGLPIATFGAVASLRRGSLAIGLRVERTVDDARSSAEGKGEVVLSDVIATLGYRRTARMGRSLQLFVGADGGGGVGWVEAQGQLAAQDAVRSVTPWLPLLRLQISAGFVLWRRLELHLGANADIVLDRARILLRDQDLAVFGPVIPRFEVGLQVML